MPDVCCLSPPATVTANDGTVYVFENEDPITMPTAHAETVTTLPNFDLA